MKTLSKIALIAVTSAGLAAPAVAGGFDEPVMSTPVAPVAFAPTVASRDWTGGYVGAQLGYGNITAQDGAGAEMDGSGMTYGLRAGYDYDFGSYVLGAGIDYDKSDIELDGGAGDIDSIARLKLRAGADLGRTLLYATAGVAYAEANVGAANYSGTGYFGGAGVEYMVTDAWSVGGEVLLHKFNDFDDSGIDMDATTAAVNVNYRF